MSASAQETQRNSALEVLDAVLDSLYHSHGDQPAMVIVADSLYARLEGIAYQGRLLLAHQRNIDSSTVADFELVTGRTAEFPRDYRYKSQFHVLSQVERQQLLTRGNALAGGAPPGQFHEMPLWMSFVEKYPQAWGITVLSRVGFNRDTTQALTTVRHQCGDACYSVEAILLEQRDRKWRIIERIDHHSHEALGIGALRYLGPGAHVIADIRRREDSTRRAVADSIRRDRLPRRVHGTVYNAATGQPIPRAQVFIDLQTGMEKVRIGRTVADSRGRYEFANPPIGGRQVLAECPGTRLREGGALDLRVLYVHPQLDTTLDLHARTMEPCWWPRSVHRIESGELSFQETARLPHPTPDEAAIYSVLLADARLAGEPFLVASETYRWCEWRTSYCPKLIVPHLIRSGEIDSVTIRNFRAVSQDVVPLNPAAMRRIGARLFARGERSYLEHEAAAFKEFHPAEADQNSFWSLLPKAYGGARSIVSFTAIGFNDRHDEAIVAYSSRRSNKVREGTVLLKRTNASWEVVNRSLSSERPSAALVDGACAPVRKPADPPTAEDLSDVIGDYLFNLVSSGVADRELPWRMRFLRDTTGSTVFQVLDSKSGRRLEEYEPGTYVGSGKIRFPNAGRVLQFDGSGIALTIDRVEKGLLFGYWEHYSFGMPIDRNGHPIPEPAGHFCAKRISP